MMYILGTHRWRQNEFLQYPSIHIIASKLKSKVLKGGYFSIDRLEVFAVKCNDHDSRFNPSIVFSDDGYNVAKCMRVVVGLLLATHFGDAIIVEVFYRYRKIIADCISKEKTQFIKVTISMTKIVIYGWLNNGPIIIQIKFSIPLYLPPITTYHVYDCFSF